MCRLYLQGLESIFSHSPVFLFRRVPFGQLDLFFCVSHSPVFLFLVIPFGQGDGGGITDNIGEGARDILGGLFKPILGGLLEPILVGLMEPILGGLMEPIIIGLSSILDNIGSGGAITRFCNPIIVGFISGLYLS